MTENKPIIINGVDVSKCTHYAGGECLIDYYLMYGYEISHYGYCKDCKDCYFKQLARKTQECEIWKNQVLILDGEDVTVQITQEQFEEYNQLKAENERLKQKNSILEDEFKILEDNLDSRTRDFEDVIEHAEQKLERIEAYCKEQNLKADYTACEILQIIDEVE